MGKKMEARGRREVKERREEGLNPRWLEQYGRERGRRVNGRRLLRYGGRKKEKTRKSRRKNNGSRRKGSSETTTMETKKGI